MAQHGNSSTNVQVHTHAEGLLIMRIMLIIHIRLLREDARREVKLGRY